MYLLYGSNQSREVVVVFPSAMEGGKPLRDLMLEWPVCATGRVKDGMQKTRVFLVGR